MDISKIKAGKRVAYRSRKNEGRGKVVETYTGETGHWVKIHDAARNATVVVRPSQVEAI
jgi:hypothetical protein